MENVTVLWRITLNVNTLGTNLGIPDDSGLPKACKKPCVLAFVYMLFNEQVQRDEASFSCYTNSSSNLATCLLLAIEFLCGVYNANQPLKCRE